MTVAWWEKAGNLEGKAPMEAGKPILIPGGRATAIAALSSRIAAYVPEWRNLSQEDAGVALVKLFGVQLELVLARLERLPDKALIEFLSTAGIRLRPPRPAEALLAFEAAPNIDGTLVVPSGFQLSSAPADESEGDVIWETKRTFVLSSAVLEEIWVLNADGTIRQIEKDVPFYPLSDRPMAGVSLMLGFAAGTHPGTSLTLGIEPEVSEVAGPVATGGAPIAQLLSPLMRWEAMVDGQFKLVEVILDESNNFTTSGIIELRLPRGWGQARPSVVGDGDTLYWLRLRLIHGGFPSPPHLAFIRPHMVPAQAILTIRDEFPEPLGGSSPRQVQLSQRPILPGSLVLEVDEGAAGAGLFEFDEETAGEDGFRRWLEVKSFAGQSPDARVFTLDPVSGVVTFGDDREGMAPPNGVRNIVARSYALARGRASAVEAENITGVRQSLAGLASLTNPRPAIGGSDGEAPEAAMRRGPVSIKARGRAVTESDMALLAQSAEGADIAHAFALSGIDPTLPGMAIPGVVGIFVVPHRRPGDESAGPPSASSQVLGAVAAYLAKEVGPLGAHIIAANPRYHRVKVEAAIALDPAADAGTVVGAVLQTLDRYLDPYTGGEAGTGWRMGASLRHIHFVHQVLDASDKVISVPFLSLVVDGIRYPACTDVPLSDFGLTWPSGHEIVPIAEERNS